MEQLADCTRTQIQCALIVVVVVFGYSKLADWCNLSLLLHFKWLVLLLSCISHSPQDEWWSQASNNKSVDEEEATTIFCLCPRLSRTIPLDWHVLPTVSAGYEGPRSFDRLQIGSDRLGASISAASYTAAAVYRRRQQRQSVPVDVGEEGKERFPPRVSPAAAAFCFYLVVSAV